MNLHRNGGALLAASILLSPSLAQGEPDAHLSGHFTAAGYSATIEKASNVLSVKLNRTVGRCSAQISGSAIALNTNVISLSKRSPPVNAFCTIDIFYESNFDTIEVKESAACLAFHGAGCDFSATLSRHRL